MIFFVKLMFVFTLLLLVRFTTPPGKIHYQVKKVVLDPGHGGKDAGALGKFSKEKDITLQVALELGKLFKQHMKDVQVLYTRQQDEFIPLYQRANKSNKNNADVFISIHCNACKKNKNAHGVEIFTMGVEASNKNLAVTKTENSVILIEDNPTDEYQGFDPKSPASHILFSLYQNVHAENSLKLAHHIEQGLNRYTPHVSRGVKQDLFLVLWKTAAPSVLVEIGFITNPEEEKYLTQRAGQTQIATAIFEGFKNYKYEMEH